MQDTHGRVVWQMLVRINKAFANKTIHDLEAIQNLIKLAQSDQSRKIHLMGLVSDGGVHSSLDHLLGLTELFKELGLDYRVFVHAFMDGRDTDPRSGQGFIEKVTESSKFGKAKLATIIGRYYAMDRDQRWERTKLAYDALIHGKGDVFEDFTEALQYNYDHGVTDEFIKPSILNQSGQISDDDIVLSFNFRTDECGTPCQLCKTKKCDIDAIHKDGSIDYGECIQCLECVVTIENPTLCVIDKYKGKKPKTEKELPLRNQDVIVVKPV